MLPLQAHTNVRDVLAPLFCNGRSFANLIDDLSRHFKFDSNSSQSNDDDADDDEKWQSTDSEAEGNISDEADDSLVQARLSAQARSMRGHAQPARVAAATAAAAATNNAEATAESHPRPKEKSHGPQALAPKHATTSSHDDDNDGNCNDNARCVVYPVSSSTATTSPTTLRLGRRGRMMTPGVRGGEGAAAALAAASAEISRRIMSRKTVAAPTSASLDTRHHQHHQYRSSRRGRRVGAATAAAPAPAKSISARVLPTRGKAASRGSKGGRAGMDVTASTTSATSSSLHGCRPCFGGVDGSGGGGSAGGGGGGGGWGSSKGSISGDVLTVMSVTANADGWSEAVGAALATRARAGYVFAQEVDPDSPLSTEFLREEFTDERSGARKALEVRLRLIPSSQKVLLCSAWVDSGEYLAAAAKLVAQCQAHVFGIACVRFEQNPSTQGLIDRFNLFAKSMPKGSVPSLNVGMKSCIPASITKGFHTYTYSRREMSGGTQVSGASHGNGSPGVAAAASPANRTADARQNRGMKRRRSRDSPTDNGPSPSSDSLLQREEMPSDEEEEKGGLPAPAADEASAGEGLAESGDGGKPAGKRFGGGGGGVNGQACGSGGGIEGPMLMDGVVFSGEEGDYAADSERSTDHESMKLSGGGGSRESDEQELSEREKEMARRGRGRRRGSTSQGSDGSTGSGVGSATEAGGRRTRGKNAARGARGGGLGGGGSTSKQSTGGEQLMASRRGASTPKRRKLSGADGRQGLGNRGVCDGEETKGSRELRPQSEKSKASRDRKCRSVESSIREGARDGGHVDVDVDLDDAEHEDDLGKEGRVKAEKIKWKIERDGQPILMSRGQQPEEHHRDLLLSLNRRSGGGVNHEETRRGGTRSTGLSSLCGPPMPSPEDDCDRASSCSSFDCPGVDRKPDPIARSEGRSGKRDRGKNGTGCDVTDGDADNGSWVGTGGSGGDGDEDCGVALAAPNTSGGAVPWHHTSVYEANDPTEDRHVELADEGLGVRIYCVCDGHGGSRAAQFVCDNLANDVLARVEAVVEVTPRRGRRATAGGGSSRGSSKNISTTNVSKDVWAGGVDNGVVRRLLKEAFAHCDEQFIAQLDPKKNRGYINAGCCVVLALMIRSRLFVAHVGDCRAVLGTTDAARFPPEIISLADNTTAAGATSAGGAGARATLMDTKNECGTGNLRKGGSAAVHDSKLAPSPTPFSSSTSSLAGALRAEELTAVALSRDHNCNDEDEVSLVRARSGDEKAIRVSRNDEWKGARAIRRVAGSLAVTRAIGDAYLKEAVFSFSPYKEGVPYITSEPAVTALDLTSADRFLVLATDGVWEQVSNEEAVQCVSSALNLASGRLGTGLTPLTMRRQPRAGAGGAGGGMTSDALVNTVLARSAQGHGMSVSNLRALPRGPPRRMLHDDVCATVVHLVSHGQPEPLATLD